MAKSTTGLHGHVYGPKGWQMSKAATEDPETYSTILQVAKELNVPGCIGGRIGRGVRQMNGLLQTGLTHLLIWDSDNKEEMNHFEIEGQLHIDFTRLIENKWTDANFIQFITMEEQVLEHITEQNQDYAVPQNRRQGPPNPGIENGQEPLNTDQGMAADVDIRSEGSRSTAAPHPSEQAESWGTDEYEHLPPEQGVVRPRSEESLGSLGQPARAARTDDHPGLRPSSSDPPEDWHSMASDNGEDEDE